MICSCLSVRSGLEKRLIFVVVGLSLLLLCFIVSLVIVKLPPKTSLDQEIKVCRTERCKAAGEYVLSSIDRKLDPCQDFYLYCCKAWKAHQNLPVEVPALLSNEAHQKALAILRNTSLTESTPKSLKNAINFYKMCNNATKINIRGLNPIRKSLQDLGGWPAIDQDWNSDDYDWMASEVKALMWTRLSFLIGFTIGADPQNSSNLMVQLGMFTSRGNFNSSDYRNSIRNVLSFFDDQQDYQQDIDDIVQLETELMQSYDANKTELINLTVAELEVKTNYTRWENYLQRLVNGTSMTIKSDTPILTDNLHYLTELGRIMERESPRRIANFLGWKFLSYLWLLLPDALLAQFEPAINLARRETACYDFVQTVFNDILWHVYIKNYFQIPTKDKSQRLMKILLEEFVEMIGGTDWLDERTKVQAIKKAQAIKFHSAFPDWLIDATVVEKIYDFMREIEIDGEDVLEAYLMLSKFHMEKLISSITTSNGTQKNPFEANAYYRRSTNEFAVSPAMLRPPFYHDQNPWYLNIGALGSVIGHEMTHAFDGQGRAYDERGHRRDWWNETTAENFVNRSECFASQYQNYGVPGFSNKRAEIIADNGGIRIAYKTYKNLAPKEDLVLPGFEDLTQDQLFFIAFGMIYCSNSATEVTVSEQYNYPPKRFRVNIPVQNMKEFSDAFKCDWSSSMNPGLKCILW